MVLLLTDVFLVLTQVLLWMVVGLVTWFVLLRALPRAFLSLMVLLLILVILALSFINGPPRDSGVLEILWRIISFPFSPLGLALILLLILFFNTKISKLIKNIIYVGLILLALGSVPLVSQAMAQELEMEAIELIRPLPALTGGGRRVIVILGQDTTRPFLRPRLEARPSPPKNVRCPQGCSPSSAPPRVDRPISEDAYQVLSQLPVQLTDRGNSLIYAAQLYQQETRAGTNPLIVVSASTYPGRRQKDGEKREDISEARNIQRFLTQTLGVPETAILLDHESSTVHRSAERVKQLITDQGVNPGNQVTLVTTALNMNRSALTFERVFDGTVVNARPTNFYTIPSSKSFSLILQGRDLIERQVQVIDLIPSADAFCLSTKAIDEYIASLYYFLRGWIRPFQRTVPANPIPPVTPPVTPTPLPTSGGLFPRPRPQPYPPGYPQPETPYPQPQPYTSPQRW
jgi:uncharacterized SAM-binding protein YcdF (DUF218 family)